MKIDYQGQLNLGLGTYSVTELNVIRVGDSTQVSWLYRDELFPDYLSFQKGFYTNTNAERIHAHTNIIKNFESPHSVIGHMCRDYLINVKTRDSAYSRVAQTLQFLRDRLNYSPPVANHRGAGYVSGAAVPNFEPLSEELREWTSQALSSVPVALPHGFRVPLGLPSLGYISDPDWYFGHLNYYFHCPAIPSVISTEVLGTSFRDAAFQNNLTVHRLKDYRRFARTGHFSFEHICGVFLGADSTTLAPFFLYNPNHRRSQWEVIALFYDVAGVIKKLRLGIHSPLCNESSFETFIPRTAASWAEKSRKDHASVPYVDTFFAVCTEEKSVEDWCYKLRFIRPILSG